MNTPEDFVAWALSPDLTVEEAYFAERLVEHAVQFWESQHQIHRGWDWESHRAKTRGRKLNPAHRVSLAKEAVTRTAEVLPQMNHLSVTCNEDRPLRDISGLRFLPHLKNLNLSGTEIGDLSPIGALAQLNELWLMDSEAEDLRPVSRCTALRLVSLSLQQPWPLVAGFEKLASVEWFIWNGNLMVLEEVPTLPGVVKAKFEGWIGTSLPLRNCRRLPEMPRLEDMELGPVHRLEGMARWPQLRNLVVGGPFRELGPLAEARRLTHLTIKGNLTRDLSPLARLPKLRCLVVESSHPQDYSVLSEAPLLHEVEAKGCKINKLELGTLRAMLAPWEDEFIAPKPRPLGPLRFRVTEPRLLGLSPRRKDDRDTDVWDGDGAMAESEGKWFAQKLGEGIRRGLRHRRWGEVGSCSGGLGYMTITSLEAAERLPEIVRITREFLATTRYPWQVQFRVDLGAEWARTEENDEELSEAVRLQREIQVEADEHIEWTRRKKEQEEFLEREHRLRLIQQEGRKVKPEQFAAPDAPAAESRSAADSPAPEEVDAGDVLEQQRQDAGLAEAREHPLADVLDVLGTITEEAICVRDKNRAAAVHLMGRKPDEG